MKNFSFIKFIFGIFCIILSIVSSINYKPLPDADVADSRLLKLSKLSHEHDAKELKKMDKNIRRLIPAPIIAAVFATSVSVITTWANSYDCNFWDSGVCENVRIQINNHFCGVSMRYVERRVFNGEVRGTAQSSINPGSGESAGEYYGKSDGRGVVRYSINLGYTGGDYNIDIWWCLDCTIYYGSLIVDDSWSKDEYKFGIMISPGYISDEISLDDSYKCLYNTFYNSHKNTETVKNWMLLWSEDTPWWCTYPNKWIYAFNLFDDGGNKKRTIGYNDGNIGLWIESEMTQYSKYREIEVDVWPYSGWYTDNQKDECSS